MGRLYYLTEKYKQAAESFARVLYAIDHPDEFALDQQLTKVLLSEPGPTYQLMGECFLSADRPQEALAVFEKADQVAPNKALRQFNLARVYAKTGKPAEALAGLGGLLCRTSGRRRHGPVRNAGRRAGSLGKKDELLGRLEKLRAAEPNNVPLGYYLAAQYRAAGKTDKAESLYLELLKTSRCPAATAAWSRSIGRPSGSTPCWPSWARPWRRPACWTFSGPRPRRSPATPSRCAGSSKPRGAR